MVAIGVAAVLLFGWAAVGRRRTAKLRGQFGSEYDRTVESTENKREAEAELAARVERREQLEIKPLTAAARDRYTVAWQAVQAQFVDDPPAAVGAADRLVSAVMAERGYPMDDFEQRAADISVDHPDVVEHYRAAHGIATGGSASTEELRRAMQHERALFESLLEAGADEPITRDPGGLPERAEEDRVTN